MQFLWLDFQNFLIFVLGQKYMIMIYVLHNKIHTAHLYYYFLFLYFTVYSARWKYQLQSNWNCSNSCLEILLFYNWACSNSNPSFVTFSLNSIVNNQTPVGNVVKVEAYIYISKVAESCDVQLVAKNETLTFLEVEIFANRIGVRIKANYFYFSLHIFFVVFDNSELVWVRRLILFDTHW